MDRLPRIAKRDFADEVKNPGDGMITLDSPGGPRVIPRLQQCALRGNREEGESESREGEVRMETSAGSHGHEPRNWSSF